MPALTVMNAEVKTAAVEIELLKIGGKQVTLAVFRQLQREELIDDKSGRLNGAPWGTVNYHPYKNCAETPDHWHVVWQKDRELRQCFVAQQADWPLFHCDEGDRFLTAVVGEMAAPDGTLYWAGKPPIRYDGSRPYLQSKIDGIGIVAWPTDAGAKVLRGLQDMESNRDHVARGWGVRDPSIECRLNEARTKLAAEVASWKSSTSMLANAWNGAIAREADRRRRHEGVRRAIADLPQLFIAV